MVAVGMLGPGHVPADRENCGLCIYGLYSNRDGDPVATAGFSVGFQEMPD